jgi:transposase
MQTILHNCCGLDVHKNSIVACIIKTSNNSVDNHNNNEVIKEIREFGTIPDELKKLRKWIDSRNCQHVAMESTGVYWLPIYEVLENAIDGKIEILVVNARHMKNVPGKKTDIKDAEWIASLLRAGLLRGSFVPSKEVREFRQLTRYRKNIVHDICKQKNRIEKTLQMACVKLSSFLTDIFGVSGRNLINILIVKGRLSKKDVENYTKCISEEKKMEIKRCVNVHLSDHQRNVLKMQITLLDELLAHLESVEHSIADFVESNQEDIERLETIPGIGTTAASAIIAEIGTDMSKFSTSEHISSWAGLAPGNNESAGKKKVHVSLTETPK